MADDYERAVQRRKAAEGLDYRQQNASQARQKAEARTAALRADEEQRRREIDAALSSNLLTESASQTVRVDDPRRFRPDHFKGFSAGQRRQIMEDQQAQMTEAQRRREQQAAEERARAEEDERYRRELVRRQQEKQRMSARSEAELRAEQLRQKEEAVLR
jgi:hypothetical protein